MTVSEQFELAIDDSWHPERAAIPSLEQLPTNTVDGNNVGDDLASLSHPTATPFENQQRELTVPAAIATRDERTNAPQAKQRLEANEAPPKPDEKKIPKSASPLLSRFLATRAATNRPAVGIRPPDQFSGPDKPDSDSDDTDPLLGDPELGVVQVAEVQRDDELGVIQLRSPLQDAELGILELQQISQLSRRAPFVFLSGYITASSSDNVFLVEDPVQGRFGDNFIRPGVTITAFPALGPNTNLLVSGRTSFLRYEEQSNSSYDELRVQAGVRHRFTNRVYGQLSVSNQLLFDEGYRDRFFTNTGLELLVGRRDRLTPQLTLDTLYQGQIFFSDPNEFSNVLNSVGASLNYRMSPQWDTSISYRLTISDFTQQSRHETYQRVIGQLRYSITPSVRMSLFGGLSYGRSSESRITFDDTFFGISFDATISIF
ncbi:MAG: hypothetical protein AAGF98_16615 [Cyanobacteria bacterium P01_H01_bin.153]